MSGHSKWSTIKRKKGANDAARGKLFTKLAREIQVAARSGADPATNFTLRLAVERARMENMPKENIERAIRRGAGLEKEVDDIEEVTYEGYGPHGIAILVNCLTDNRNRTIAEVRRCFTRANGNLGEPGSVAWQFTEVGYILFNRQTDDGEPRDLDPEAIFMAALEAGAEDVVVSEDAVEVYTARNDLAQVSQALTEAGFEPDESKLIMRPNTTIALEPDEATTVLNLIEALEELDDVNNVYHNLELTDEVMAQLA
ncbi:YebC/PmpR family DNA-binding transcriptional regulator [Litorilinea aerophila]|uniref:Probable transcriptional regulatory protein FKZ61_21060 n=1 Tax=Litorilinea aerophila TaxID=1204385 RepID=A0A540V9X8_9CHLR|nr:YebC/PmpR family DNA-binding transcriptional regulator [Litorilinea aerophila]MCC9078612.1 YebC/PmpR family DNA-binding transcriptional regulator [Litorilinea aerophila]OUC05476.1 transcriptional regulator [Litorilinea aerophila]GIV77059.1 MAG: putative transcriptional regulatory protein [Litorilinea sp.]